MAIMSSKWGSTAVSAWHCAGFRAFGLPTFSPAGCPTGTGGKRDLINKGGAQGAHGVMTST
ncbi:hypothetical protein GCM10010309_27040 [Streptomyces violaceochromogenes]|nr:hypothetical protein GCM10010309_27040 [Streptomyces violaceochromogenes]